MAFLRSLLALSRPAALPTVCSNCLAGWWLGGGRSQDHLPLLLGGATALYLGGAFLNDAFDVSQDRQHRRHRPIPAGEIDLKAVWRWGLGWLIAGVLLLFRASFDAGLIALGLVCLIVLFNSLHRLPWVAATSLGLCRALLYVLGATVAARGVTGWAVWCGIALGTYAAGLELLSTQPGPRPARAWPVALLTAPILLALILNAGDYRGPALLLAAILALWGLRCLRPLFWSGEPNLGRAISGLASGMVLVDWLAACPVQLEGRYFNAGGRELSILFLALFLATVLIQSLDAERALPKRKAPA